MWRVEIWHNFSWHSIGQFSFSVAKKILETENVPARIVNNDTGETRFY